MLAEERGKRIGQHLHIALGRAREPARQPEDQPRMWLPPGEEAQVESREIPDVLGHDRSIIGCRDPNQVLVSHADEVGSLLDGDGVVPPVSQQGRDGGSIHLVEQELHPVSSLRSFSQAANSRSAISSFSAISASISSVNSA